MSTSSVTRLLDLSRSSDRWTVKRGSAKALSVTAVKVSGAWVNRTITVKRFRGGVASDFPSAKALTANAPTVQCTADELAGLEEIQIGLGGSADTGHVQVIVSFEYEAGVSAPVNEDTVVVGGFEEVNGGGRVVVGS